MINRQNTRLDTIWGERMRALTAPFYTFLMLIGMGRDAQAGGQVPSIWRQQKRGKTDIKRPHAILGWVHAHSETELLASMPFLNALQQRDLHILATTNLPPKDPEFGNKLVAQFQGKLIYVAAPTDRPPYVYRFLHHWHPDMAFFVDKELWPNMLRRLDAHQIPAILVNARISENGFDYWLQRADEMSQILKYVSLICAQNIEYLDRFEALGAREVADTGNLRFDAIPSLPDSRNLAELKRMIGTRPLFLAANTHPGEERIIANVHLALKPHLPNLLTIIVPRSPERAAPVKAMLDSELIKVVVRSTGKVVQSHHDILLVDTYAELPLYYSAASFAFLGGSMTEVGGHNPIEALQYHCATLFGSYTYNFSHICDKLIADGGAIRVADAKALGRQVFYLLADPKRAKNIQAAAQKSLQSQEGAMQKTIRLLEPFLANVQIDTHLQQTRGRK